MTTKLSSGGIVPFGLLSSNTEETAIAAFNRSYKNTGIKAGLVKRSYSPTDPENQNGLCTEYDILTIEQMENKGTTSILYKNCVSTQGFGSIADYFECTLRPLLKQSSKGFPDFSNQDGAIVLIQCLNNIGDKAVVIGNLIHPDRTTNVTDNSPQLYGEYNGVKIQINDDGSCSLIFKGATDSQGKVINSSQGNTEFQIKTDGSFQFNHSTINIQADKSGVLTINAKSDANIVVGGNVNAIVSGNTNLTTTGKTIVTSKEIDLNIKNPDAGHGILTSNSSDGIVDYITGVPLQPSTTTFGDV